MQNNVLQHQKQVFNVSLKWNWDKILTLLFLHFLYKFMERKLSTSFVHLLSFLSELWSFEFDVSDVIPGNMRNLSLLLFCCYCCCCCLYIFVNFVRKELSIKSYGAFDHFSQSCEGLYNQRCIDARDVTSANEIFYMLVVAYM